MRRVLLIDTATEQVVAGVGCLADSTPGDLTHSDGEAPRRANTELLARLGDALRRAGLTMRDIDVVVVGRGPGSFTGVRIGVATAKGLAQGLGVPLYGVGTLDAIAHGAARAGVRGLIGVVGDAMRGEVYPALFRLDAAGVERLTDDEVAKPEVVATRWAEDVHEPITLMGNGLRKYGHIFAETLGERGSFVEEALWAPGSHGLLAAFGRDIDADRLRDGDPALVLPVYTRLSDAEEAEIARDGAAPEAPPESGVRGGSGGFEAVSGPERTAVVWLRPMRSRDLDEIGVLEDELFSDSWTRGMFAEELQAPGRVWLVAERAGEIVGYGGIALLVDQAHVMNLAVAPDAQRQGVGGVLLGSLEAHAMALGAEALTLEVRERNAPAIALYRAYGFTESGRRAGYYGDTGEAAVIMAKALPALREEGEVILAIETSCDETAAAVMRGGRGLIASVVSSQIGFHARFGGVVPEIASRKHTEAVVSVVDEALAEAGSGLGLHGALPFSALDAIAVTNGPGLVGALVVGLAYAKGLSMATGIPLVGVNHLEGHIFANVLADPEVTPPLVALVVSGGHTSLVHMPEWGVYRTMGETLDDAAGEAFDKVAKVLGLGYPGGPILSKLAADGDPKAIDFPRAMMRSGDYQFSLSGLKTAVINHIRHEQAAGREIDIPDLAASFQAAVVDVQVAKAVRAVIETEATSFCLAGGVAANPSLRGALQAAIEPLGVRVSVPPFQFCTDNAAMIAAAAHYRFTRGEFLGLEADAVPGLRLDTE